MTIIIEPAQMHESRRGVGWVELTIADTELIGAASMVARRWSFEPGVRGPDETHGDTDQLLYVIKGSGTAVVDGEEFALGRESVLWLEPGENYYFVAGDDGLEVLQGYTPGD